MVKDGVVEETDAGMEKEKGMEEGMGDGMEKAKEMETGMEDGMQLERGGMREIGMEASMEKDGWRRCSKCTRCSSRNRS